MGYLVYLLTQKKSFQRHKLTLMAALPALIFGFGRPEMALAGLMLGLGSFVVIFWGLTRFLGG